MSKVHSLEGKRFGKLVVTHRAENVGKFTRWQCRCDCGGNVIVRSSSLRCGYTKSCGCLLREFNVNRSTTHGQAKRGRVASTYIAWNLMMDRCGNKNNKRYDRYGGRGIRVCERWKKFENFLEDMGPRPSSKHSLDRFPDNDGDYQLGNCRWATLIEQGRNKSNNVVVRFRGESKCLAAWVEQFSLDYHLVWYRICRLKWDAEKAFSTPAKQTGFNLKPMGGSHVATT